MTEAELYKELGILTKDKGRWKESMFGLEATIERLTPLCVLII